MLYSSVYNSPIVFFFYNIVRTGFVLSVSSILVAVLFIFTSYIFYTTLGHTGSKLTDYGLFLK